MIKTFLIDLPVMILFGVLFAVFTRHEGEDLFVFKSSYFWHGVVFSTIFNMAVIYAAVKYPDWMWMYFLEESHNSIVELVYLFLFLYYLPYILGFYLGRLAILKGVKWWLICALFFIGWEVWIVNHLFDRYSVVGTREDYLNGQAISLFSPQNPIGPVLNVSVGAMVIYYLVLILRYRKTKRFLAETEY